MGAQPALLWIRGTSGWVPSTADSLGNLTVALSGHRLKARIFNTALPAANTDLLTSGILPATYGGFLIIYVAFSVAGLFYARRTVSAVSVDEYFNSGVPLVANCLYAFSLSWRSGDTINFRYSVTGGTTLLLDGIEVPR